ncbi:putative leader peptide [Streptomyces sp. NPDC101733]
MHRTGTPGAQERPLRRWWLTRRLHIDLQRTSSATALPAPPHP